MSTNYIKYIHSINSENTLRSFFEKNSVFTGDIKTNVKGFLLFQDSEGRTNIDKIFFLYELPVRIQNNATYFSIINGSQQPEEFFNRPEILNLPLYIGTELAIPKVNFNPELISVTGKNLFLEQEDDFNFLWSKKLYQIVNSDGYVRSQQVNLGGDLNYSIELINQNIQIWVWSRALNKIIDLSPFVVSCNTSKQEVGSFSITFNPIKQIDRLTDFDNNILHYFNLNEDGKNNIDFIHQYLQLNDIVFIRFEKLQLEEKSEKKEAETRYSYEIGKHNLPGKVWDMIGLVDNCSLRSNLSDTNYEVSVTGRDLMKLLTEDASYWIPLSYIQGEKAIINFGYNPEDKWFKRNIEGSFGAGSTTKVAPYQFVVGYRGIDDTIGFIVNQLSNLGVTGDVELFENYEDRRTRAYRISGANDEYLATKEIQGIWQIIKIFFDKVLSKRRVIDESLARVDGTIYEQFNKVCQKPFVEFYGDTYGDEFNLIIRQPPFTKGAIRSFLEGIEYHPSMDGTEPTIIGGEQKSRLFNVIDVDLSDIQGYDNLMWDTTYYTSYQISPKNELYGKFTSMIFGGMVPIVYIEELAKIWGNKRMTITDNYLTIPQSDSSEEDNSSYRNAIINDFKYLIDTNFYLPFTRRGSITLVKGDRRIRKGTFIRVKPTNEIFYVDAVSNSVNFLGSRIERTTNIQVSRGMVEDYIFGAVGYDSSDSKEEIRNQTGSAIKFSYFDMLRTIMSKKKVIREIKKQRPVTTSYIAKKYSVNIGVKNSPAGRNNSPGNLNYVGQTSAERGEFRYLYTNPETGISTPVYWAKFATPEIGFDEVIRQIGLYSTRERSNTIEKAISTYAPASENKTEEYINFVCNWLGKSRSTSLSAVDHFEVARAIVKMESQTVVSVLDKPELVNQIIETEEVERVIETTENSLSWYFDEDQFNFFLKRKQFNLNRRNE